MSVHARIRLWLGRCRNHEAKKMVLVFPFFVDAARRESVSFLFWKRPHNCHNWHTNCYAFLEQNSSIVSLNKAVNWERDGSRILTAPNTWNYTWFFEDTKCASNIAAPSPFSRWVPSLATLQREIPTSTGRHSSSAVTPRAECVRPRGNPQRRRWHRQSTSMLAVGRSVLTPRMDFRRLLIYCRRHCLHHFMYGWIAAVRAANSATSAAVGAALRCLYSLKTTGQDCTINVSLHNVEVT